MSAPDSPSGSNDGAAIATLLSTLDRQDQELQRLHAGFDKLADKVDRLSRSVRRTTLMLSLLTGFLLLFVGLASAAAVKCLTTQPFGFQGV